MICWHNWEKWSSLVQGYNGHKVQLRKCKKCHKAQWRDLGYAAGIETDESNGAIFCEGVKTK